MIISISNLSFNDINLENFINLTASLGFNNIEISPYILIQNFNNKNFLRKIKDLLKKNNIKIISFQSVFYFLNKNCKIKNNKVVKNYIKKIYFLCNYFNVRNIVFGNNFLRQKKNTSNYFKNNINLLNDISNTFKNKKIFISVEPIHKKYKNRFLVNHDEVFNLLKFLKKKNLKILLDLGNIIAHGHDFKNYYKKYISYIEHVHLSGKNIYEFNSDEIVGAIKFLKKKHFCKSVSIEYVGNLSINFIRLLMHVKSIV